MDDENWYGQTVHACEGAVLGVVVGVFARTRYGLTVHTHRDDACTRGSANPIGRGCVRLGRTPEMRR